MRAKKSLGQNFLVDANFQRKIVRALDVGPDDEILEIGSGTGATTKLIMQHIGPARLIGIDPYPVFLDMARDTFGENPRV